MKQTAVEFLLEKQNSQMGMLLNSDFIKAQEMFKQEIIDAWDRGQYIGSSFPNNQIEVEFEKDAEQYYNETFKK